MKKDLFIPVCVLLCLIFTLFSCSDKTKENGGDEEKGEITEAVTETNDAAIREAAVERIRTIVTPTEDGATVVTDDVVYSTGGKASRNYIISTKGGLFYLVPTAGGEHTLLCRDENCEHDDLSCTAASPYGSSVMYLIESVDGEKAVLYYTAALKKDYSAVDGYGTEELGIDKGLTVLFELNLKTCTRRTVAVLDLEDHYRLNGYYKGKMFLTGHTESPEGPDKNEFLSAVLDVKTGEKSESGYAGVLCGMHDGKLYFWQAGGLYRCGTDLSGLELVGNYGNFDVSATEQAVYIAVCEGDIISKKELYRLEDDGTKTHIASDIYKMRADGGDVYFTKYDRKEYGTYGTMIVSSSVGGTLYRYDCKTGEIETVFEDCGGDPENIDYIDDCCIIFSGCYYAGLAKEHKYTDTDNGNAYFGFNLDTGEVIMLYEFFS